MNTQVSTPVLPTIPEIPTQQNLVFVAFVLFARFAGPLISTTEPYIYTTWPCGFAVAVSVPDAVAVVLF